MVKNSKRCEIRSFEIIYEDVDPETDLSSIAKALCSKQYGVYKAFYIKHTKEGKTHIHSGVIFRDKPKTLKWEELKEYFTIQNPKSLIPTEHGALKNKSKSFDKKLQTYYEYCTDQEKHPGETISEPHFHKWQPMTEQEKMTPDDYIIDLIRKGMTVEELEEIIDDPETTTKVFKQALKNFEIYEKMINKLADIRDRKAQAKLYKEATEEYRPFQKSLTKILDTQNDRNIHCHFDEGNTGKNYWLDREICRKDTLVIQSAETKRIAYAWNPKKHKRIIIDVPKGKMEYLNTSALEKLKNGFIFSTMHKPIPKKSTFKPSIIIVGNEACNSMDWTEDRATFSTTDKESYELKML